MKNLLSSSFLCSSRLQHLQTSQTSKLTFFFKKKEREREREKSFSYSLNTKKNTSKKCQLPHLTVSEFHTFTSASFSTTTTNTTNGTHQSAVTSSGAMQAFFFFFLFCFVLFFIRSLVLCLRAFTGFFPFFSSSIISFLEPCVLEVLQGSM
jgi:hypothetical protein